MDKEKGAKIDGTKEISKKHMIHSESVLKKSPTEQEAVTEMILDGAGDESKTHVFLSPIFMYI